MPILAHAVAAAARLEMLLIAEVDQGIESVHAFRNHVAAATAVAAVRTAELDELLAPECDAAVAAVAGANVDLGFVEKFHAANMRALARYCEGAADIMSRKIALLAGRAEEGPCLTDAARVAAPDAQSVEYSRLRRDPNDAAAIIAAMLTRGHTGLPAGCVQKRKRLQRTPYSTWEAGRGMSRTARPKTSARGVDRSRSRWRVREVA